MRKNNTAIIVITVFVLLFTGAAAIYNVSGGNRDAAVETAHAYARDLHIEVEAVTCARMDSDGDGYVGCTIMPKGEQRQPIMVECTGGWTWNDGCRLPKSAIRSGG